MKAIKREAPICLALFLIALLPRLLSLDAFITWDEPMWTYRSALAGLWVCDRFRLVERPADP